MRCPTDKSLNSRPRAHDIKGLLGHQALAAGKKQKNLRKESILVRRGAICSGERAETPPRAEVRPDQWFTSFLLELAGQKVTVGKTVMVRRVHQWKHPAREDLGAGESPSGERTVQGARACLHPGRS